MQPPILPRGLVIRAVAVMLATAVGLSLTLPVRAQYGHPLKGSWSGDWGPSEQDRTRLLLTFDWDGETITGLINPGRAAVPIAEVSLDPATWTVRFETEDRDPNGSVISYVVEGELHNLGSANRVITGSWTQGPISGDFTITRN